MQNKPLLLVAGAALLIASAVTLAQTTGPKQAKQPPGNQVASGPQNPCLDDMGNVVSMNSGQGGAYDVSGKQGDQRGIIDPLFKQQQEKRGIIDPAFKPGDKQIVDPAFRQGEGQFDNKRGGEFTQGRQGEQGGNGMIFCQALGRMVTPAECDAADKAGGFQGQFQGQPGQQPPQGQSFNGGQPSGGTPPPQGGNPPPPAPQVQAQSVRAAAVGGYDMSNLPPCPWNKNGGQQRGLDDKGAGSFQGDFGQGGPMMSDQFGQGKPEFQEELENMDLVREIGNRKQVLQRYGKKLPEYITNTVTYLNQQKCGLVKEDGTLQLPPEINDLVQSASLLTAENLKKKALEAMDEEKLQSIYDGLSTLEQTGHLLLKTLPKTPKRGVAARPSPNQSPLVGLCQQFSDLGKQYTGFTSTLAQAKSFVEAGKLDGDLLELDDFAEMINQLGVTLGEAKTAFVLGGEGSEEDVEEDFGQLQMGPRDPASRAFELLGKEFFEEVMRPLMERDQQLKKNFPKTKKKGKAVSG